MTDETGVVPGPDAEGVRVAEAPDVAALRSRVHGVFGQVVLTMSVLPRYRHLSLAELDTHVVAPLLRDRIAIAEMPNADRPGESVVGAVFWASVSDEVDTKIREQIGAGVFPLRLAPDDWTSGETAWILDVLTADRAQAARILMNIRKLITAERVHMHPLVTRLVGAETLRRLGARSATDAKDDD